MRLYTRTALAFAAFCLLLTACRRINEATTLGSELIPAVDNVSTFEKVLDVETDNRAANDTTRMQAGDDAALGNLNDPVFGSTTAAVFFNLVPANNGTYPFFNKDSIVGIDSVVLSLSFRAAYGDTTVLQGVKVFEIAGNSGFADSPAYRFNRPPFATTGPALGSRSYTTSMLNDSVILTRPRDTVRTNNVLRIRLNNSLGTRFASYDTLNGPNGGFRNDSIFKRLFRGVAVVPDAGTGNSLAYFNLIDAVRTRLTVYFRVTKNALVDTTSTVFIHRIAGTAFSPDQGQANPISRTPGGAWASALANGTPNDDLLYLQSWPGGSFGRVRIPGLDTFANSIIHRAELIFPKQNSTAENNFAPPPSLFLDRTGTNGDSAYLLDKDVQLNPQNGTIANVALFGGFLRSDQTYKFIITRHVQDVLIKRIPNSPLRVYAPYRTQLLLAPGATTTAEVQVNPLQAFGRVVVGGGANADPAKRTRLRIIYSRI